MSEIKERLNNCAEACLKSYEAWIDKKGSQTRETLQESIHDLRKVVSRLEIEIAVSERDKMNETQIPIPSHRSNSKSKGAVESILPDTGNTVGNNGNGGAEKKGGSRRPKTRRPAPKNNAE